MRSFSSNRQPREGKHVIIALDGAKEKLDYMESLTKYSQYVKENLKKKVSHKRLGYPRKLTYQCLSI